ncbi:ABC transporter permease [Cryptosporangium phraense]|uniref:ABC transporter permease subunit n=1 Tax=Cryptosporangium phraense TaxID=2593070 RepID=A0A545AK42_9ACTN|nr:ABC transporter permease subunit [Cryptosporangium phraense]TQS41115.1 ABC transporter permease subunit [Cryptosporangium phraense]
MTGPARSAAGALTRGRIAVGGGIVLLVALWEAAGRAGLADGFVLTPGAAVAPLLDPADRGLYARAAASTFRAAALGLAYGGGLAMLAAVIADQVPVLRSAVDRLAALANSAPWVAVGPIVLLVAGADAGPVAIAAIAVFFYVFVATARGLSASSRANHEWFTSLGAGRLRRLTSLQVPRALPLVVEGLKLAAPAALAGAVYGEWYGAERGLGVLLVNGMRAARPEPIWAAALVCAAGGLVAYGVLAGVQLAARRYLGATIAGHAVAPRGRGALTVFEGIAFAVLAIGAWEAWIRLGQVSPLVAPGPDRVWDDLRDSPGAYLSAIGHTLGTAGLGLLIGGVLGVGLAVACWWSRVVAGLTVPGLVLLAATPLVALFPLFARVFGYSGGTVVVITSFMVLLPGFVYTRAGLEAGLAGHREMARSFGGGRRALFGVVLVPSALPHLATGLRIAAGSAVVAAVVAESLIGTAGLGVDFTYAYSLLQMPRAFGAAVTIIVVSLGVFAAFGAVERVVHRRFAPAP